MLSTYLNCVLLFWMPAVRCMQVKHDGPQGVSIDYKFSGYRLMILRSKAEKMRNCPFNPLSQRFCATPRAVRNVRAERYKNSEQEMVD